MRNSKHGLKVLVLAMMSALGIMAFAAVGAQAQTLPGASLTGDFLINLAAIPDGLLALVDGTGELGFLLVPARDLKLECHETHVDEAQIHSLTDALGKVTFLECLSLSLSTGEPLPCTLTTLGSITASTLVLPILHGPAGEDEPFLLFEPREGTNFTTVSYKAGTECPLPLNNPVTGSITALPHELEAVTQTILFSPAIQLLTGDVLRYGNAPSYIHAEAELFLTGDHTGQKLGIH